MAQLLHELITDAAWKTPAGLALRYLDNSLDYCQLAACVDGAAQALLSLGIGRGERVAVFMEKREEAVLAMFGTSAAGAAVVPVNPLLKPDQVAHILRDSGARMLVTTPVRRAALDPLLLRCPELRCVLQTGPDGAALLGLAVFSWEASMRSGALLEPHRCIDSDMAALLYTSCSSGKPKGVVLSHRNLLAGTDSVMRYLGNTAQDRILAALPLSFGYGFSQLTTAFASGAAVVLMNHGPAHDILDMAERERITGLASVPSLWTRLAELDWTARHALRYITSSGGAMPGPTLEALRRKLPATRVHLMYGLTEAFRSTCLAPEQLERRPGSIGKAVPNAEVLVLRPDGSRCGPGEPGELVHRGPLVALGYWNDAARTAEVFRPLVPCSGAPRTEMALWSGDMVRMDDEGFLYFLGRTDDQIKSSGYRISPTEIEEVVYATGLVREAAAVGVPHPVLGQAIALLVVPAAGHQLESEQLLAACRAKLPAYMLPALVDFRTRALPRNQNGSLDRRLLAAELAHLFAELPAGELA